MLYVTHILISIILGFFITPYVYDMLVKYVILEQHGPDSNIIKRHTYIDYKDKTCYKLVPVTYVCPL